MLQDQIVVVDMACMVDSEGVHTGLGLQWHNDFRRHQRYLGFHTMLEEQSLDITRHIARWDMRRMGRKASGN